MSNMFLLEPRVSEEDRLWAEQHYEVKRLNDKIDKHKKKSLIGGIIVLICGIFLLIASPFTYQQSFSYTYVKSFSEISGEGAFSTTPPEFYRIFAIFIGIAALFSICMAIYMLCVAKKGSKYLITQKNVCIETLVEEKNINQNNNLSEGETNE